MRDIVAVTDECDFQAAQIPEPLAKRLCVGKGLARVVEVAERIDDGHRCPLRPLVERRLLKGAGDDASSPAFKISRGSPRGLSPADWSVLLQCVSAQLTNPDLKCAARPQ